jgi:tetratricopeptide (TPR) repeat protein
MARGLLGEQSLAIRQATLRVIGELGNERGSDLVLDVLRGNRTDSAMRGLALDALGKTGGMDYYDTLFRYTQPADEADPGVREKAWQALLAALPRGSVQQLSNTAQLFKGDPEHRVFVYEALAIRLRQQGKMDEWALQLQNLADEEMKLKTPRRAEAAGHYQEALNYWLQNNGAPLTIDELTRKVVETRLAAGQYTQAVQFAQSAIARQKEAAQAVVGPVIKNEANRLRDLGTPEGYAKARTLIDAALKMNPGLEPRHHKDLSDFLKDIDAATGGGGPGPNGPPGGPATNPAGGTPGGASGNTPGAAQ